MNIRIRFPCEAMDFINMLEGFESIAQYHCPGMTANPCEWGRVKHEDKTIYFDCIPNNEENHKTRPLTAKTHNQEPNNG